MKDFMTKRICYDHKLVTENVESDSDSAEFRIEIKENVFRLDLVCMLYFLSVNNYLQVLSWELDFVSFRTKNYHDNSMELVRKEMTISACIFVTFAYSII